MQAVHELDIEPIEIFDWIDPPKPDRLAMMTRAQRIVAVLESTIGVLACGMSVAAFAMGA